MRLTLRTLLAYLDDILEEDDTRLLKAKIEESGIATTLIERIQNSVDRPEIGALSPDAIGPLENANVMSEYLDSTLSPEQIAEIERLCLESDASLSEAAACHQILTVVLGQPARVSEQLKNRIYNLPLSDALQLMEQQTQPAADSRSAKPIAPVSVSSHTSLEIPSLEIPGPGDSASAPSAPGPDGGVAAAAPAAGVASTPGAAMPVYDTDAPTAIRPVGPDDSGVTAAAARIRNHANLDEDSGRSEAEIVAGATRAMLSRTDGYGGAIRPSRIAPWLVALALAGVVLYVLGQIFAPLSQRDRGAVAMVETDKNAVPSPVAKPPLVSPKVVTEPETPTPTDSSTETSSGDAATTDAATTDAATTDAATIQATRGEEMTGQVPARESTAAGATVDNAAENVVVMPADPAATPGSTVETTPDSDLASESAEQPDETVVEVPMEAESAEKMPTQEIATAGDSKQPGSESPQSPGTEATVTAEKPEDDGEKLQDATSLVVAELTRPGGFLIVRDGGEWKRLVAPDASKEAVTEVNPDANDPDANKPAQADRTSSAVTLGQMVIATAYFRPILADQSGLEWTLAGPTRMKIGAEPEFGSVTQMIDGRVVLASTQPDVSAVLVLGRRHIRVAMPEAQTVLAVELTHLRSPGLNPLLPENRLPVFQILCVQGTANLQPALIQNGTVGQSGETVTLKTGQQMLGRGIQPTTTSDIGRLPAWIDPPSKQDAFIESARDGLMEFAVKDEPIEKLLREAMAFRRVEVAALAAETLLLLGRADVYFGADGILNRPRQRLYWEEHFAMLRQQMASDASAADAIRVAIERAELADSQKLYKLLVGFSPAELDAGGDEQLVAALDSASMAVRVLAIENLRLITGDTLGYRADQENANARKADIKKWETRLRRGDIRYKE